MACPPLRFTPLHLHTAPSNPYLVANKLTHAPVVTSSLGSRGIVLTPDFSPSCWILPADSCVSEYIRVIALICKDVLTDSRRWSESHERRGTIS